jgi:hypothetical protein
MRTIRDDIREVFEFQVSEDNVGVAGVDMKMSVQRTSDSKWAADDGSWSSEIQELTMAEVGTAAPGLYAYWDIYDVTAGDKFWVRYYNTDEAHPVDVSESVGVVAGNPVPADMATATRLEDVITNMATEAAASSNREALLTALGNLTLYLGSQGQTPVKLLDDLKAIMDELNDLRTSEIQ